MGHILQLLRKGDNIGSKILVEGGWLTTLTSSGMVIDGTLDHRIISQRLK